MELNRQKEPPFRATLHKHFFFCFVFFGKMHYSTFLLVFSLPLPSSS